MLQFSNILVPVDFSEPAAVAFRLACSLARDHGGRVVVLHVCPPAGHGKGHPQGHEEELGRMLRKATMDVVEGPPVPVEHLLREGDAAGEVLRFAGELGCDLIVLGTHGRTGLKRLLLGSVAEKVLRHAPCPVLTVRATPPTPAEAGSEGAVWALGGP